MLGYILGIGLLIIPLYFYKNKLIYNFLLYYDIFVNYSNKNISYTGINNQIRLLYIYPILIILGK